MRIDVWQVEKQLCNPVFTSFLQAVRKRMVAFISSYGRSLKTAPSIQTHFHDTIVGAGNGSGFSGTLETQVETLTSLFCSQHLLPSLAAFISAYTVQHQVCRSLLSRKYCLK